MQDTNTHNTVPPILMSMLSTTISWLVREEELNEAVEAHLEEIRQLNSLSDQQLRDIGITRDQITAYVLHESVEL